MNAPRIDFATLTLRDALDLALLVEEEARDRYEEFAEALAESTPLAAAFFTKLSRVEEVHRKQLEAKRRAQYGKEPSTISGSLLLEVEAPPTNAAHGTMTARQALEVALASETRAFDFFTRALTQVTDEQVRALFASLRDEEIEHQRLVRLELDRLSATSPQEGAHS